MSNISCVGNRRTKAKLNGHQNGKKPAEEKVDITDILHQHPCPFTDGNTCNPKCPMYGTTVVPVWCLGALERQGEQMSTLHKDMVKFEGCLVAAGMLALVSLANEK